MNKLTHFSNPVFSLVLLGSAFVTGAPSEAQAGCVCQYACNANLAAGNLCVADGSACATAAGTLCTGNDGVNTTTCVTPCDVQAGYLCQFACNANVAAGNLCVADCAACATDAGTLCTGNGGVNTTTCITPWDPSATGVWCIGQCSDDSEFAFVTTDGSTCADEAVNACSPGTVIEVAGMKPGHVPTVSTWGLAVMLLLILSAGTVAILRKRGAVAA